MNTDLTAQQPLDVLLTERLPGRVWQARLRFHDGERYYRVLAKLVVPFKRADDIRQLYAVRPEDGSQLSLGDPRYELVLSSVHGQLLRYLASCPRPPRSTD